MKYYKIKDGDTVIDVNHVFLKFQQKHGLLMDCPAEEAQFIQTSDQLHTYHVPWLHKVPAEYGDYETVEAVEITEDEYNALKEQLDTGKSVEDKPDEIEQEEQTPDTPAEEEHEKVLSMAEMHREIAALRASNKELAEHNEMLEECLLELSAIVYQ